MARQETIVKTYLKFNELTKEQKTKVLDKLRDINVDGDYWYDFIYDEYRARLETMGYYDIEFQFSGFWSQGDGASFSAKHENGNIYTTGMYCHSGSMRCDENEGLLSEAKAIADELYRDLEKAYEYSTSDEAVTESIEANDYEFDSETLSIV